MNTKPDDLVYQVMNQLFTQTIEDGKEIHPDNPAAYALSVISACLAVCLRHCVLKSNQDEVNMILARMEDLVQVSKTLDERNTLNG